MDTEDAYYLPKTRNRDQDNSSISSAGSDTSNQIISAYMPINERAPLLGGESLHANGLTALSAAIFVAGEMSGSGVLALPKAVVDAGWIGIVLLIIFGINSGYSGARLGDCWAIIEERYPEYRTSTRDPYAVIAERAAGPWARMLVSSSVQITLFGVGTVYVLLAAQMIRELLQPLLPNIDLCLCFLLFACLLIPVTWLGSPKDFWFIGIGALVSTVISTIFILLQIFLDGINLKGEFPAHTTHTFQDFFVAFGILLFAFGGASTFPTIQNDMIHRHEFPRSIVWAFTAILVLYIPVSFGGYLVYGDAVDSNVILSLGKTSLTTFANVFMAFHLIFAFIIVINPVAQHLEENFLVPNRFCTKRIVLRTCMMLVMIVIGETIPKFGLILSLIGGSTVTLSTFILPSYFYMRLCDQQNPSWPVRDIPLYKRTYMYEMIGIGLLGGVCSTYNAVVAILNDPVGKPCWM